jgi:hypothetical protein
MLLAPRRMLQQTPLQLQQPQRRRSLRILS